MENNKEKIKEELLNTVDRYYKEYKNLPPMDISDKELNALLDVVEAHFLVHSIMDKYNYAMNIIIRRAVYFASVENRDAFIINHLVMALNDLTAFRIPNDEIKAMQSELLEKALKHKK